MLSAKSDIASCMCMQRMQSPVATSKGFQPVMPTPSHCIELQSLPCMTSRPLVDEARPVRLSQPDHSALVSQLEEFRPEPQSGPLRMPSPSSPRVAETDNGSSSSKLAKVMAKRMLSDTNADQLGSLFCEGPPHSAKRNTCKPMPDIAHDST